MIVGPVTFLLLAKPGDGAPAGFPPLDRLADLVPVYAQLLERLAAAGAEWVQLDEPALVSETIDDPARPSARRRRRPRTAPSARSDARPAILVAAPYGSLDDALPVLAATPVEAIGARPRARRASAQLDPATEESLATKTLVAGVIDGHNIWRGDLAAAFDACRGRAAPVAERRGVDLDLAVARAARRRRRDRTSTRASSRWLAFADQKVGQVATLARGLTEGREAIEAELDEASAALADRAGAPGVREPRGARPARSPRRAGLRPARAYDERRRRAGRRARPAGAADDDHRLVPADRRHPTGTRAFVKGELDA